VTLSSQTFSPLIGLIQLSLNKNRISSLDKDIFKNLKNLVTLSLSSNALQTLDASVFSNNSRLQNLNLNDNKINALSNQTFRVIYNNRFTLDLTNNVCINASFKGSFLFSPSQQRSLESTLDTCNKNYIMIITMSTTTPLPTTISAKSNQLLNDLADLGYNFFVAMSSSVLNINSVLTNYTANVVTFTKFL
jgi:Leucine-rich repeat (LRR) protein